MAEFKKAIKDEQNKDKKGAAKARKVAKNHTDITALRKAYQEKVLDWVVKSMEFEKEPVSMARLKELIEKEKRIPQLKKEFYQLQGFWSRKAKEKDILTEKDLEKYLKK
jgi:hypothetical protein